MTTALDQLWAAYADRADDEARREQLHVLADAYRDTGDDVRADGCLWVVRTGRFGQRWCEMFWWSEAEWKRLDGNNWVWVNPSAVDDYARVRLPKPLYLRLPAYHSADAGTRKAYVEYPTAADAFRDLLDAFAAAVASGWRPKAKE